MNAMTLPGLDSWLTSAPSHRDPTAWEVSNRAREVQTFWERTQKRHLEKFTEAACDLTMDDSFMEQIFALWKSKDEAQFGHVVAQAITRELQNMAEKFATDDLNDVLGPSDPRIDSNPSEWF
jgi:hypothetical protein